MEQKLFTAIKAAVLAGEKIIEVKNTGFTTELKSDKSPLTQADLVSNELIQHFLNIYGIPVLSEEGAAVSYKDRKNWEWLWIVDPLDGTKEFVAGRKEYTTNIALVNKGKPVLGVVYVPELQVLYYGMDGLGSYKLENCQSSILTSLSQITNLSQLLPLKQDRNNYVIVASRSHLSAETKQIIDRISNMVDGVDIQSFGSSLKLCKVAEGSADLYPRLGPTMEWDIAASTAIVQNAGMKIKQYPGLHNIEFNKKDLLNSYFIVFNNKSEKLLT